MSQNANTSYVNPVTKFVVMTIMGIVLFIVGLLMVILAAPIFMVNKPENEAAFLAFTIIGFIVMCGPSLALIGVGIPCWIVTGIKSRKR